MKQTKPNNKKPEMQQHTPPEKAGQKGQTTSKNNRDAADQQGEETSNRRSNREPIERHPEQKAGFTPGVPADHQKSYSDEEKRGKNDLTSHQRASAAGEGENKSNSPSSREPRSGPVPKGDNSDQKTPNGLGQQENHNGRNNGRGQV